MTKNQSLLDELRHQIAHPDTSGAPYVNDEELLARCLAEIERLQKELAVNQEFHNIDDVVEIRKLRAMLERIVAASIDEPNDPTMARIRMYDIAREALSGERAQSEPKRKPLSCDHCFERFYTVHERVAHSKAEHPDTLAGGAGRSAQRT